MAFYRKNSSAKFFVNGDGFGNGGNFVHMLKGYSRFTKNTEFPML